MCRATPLLLMPQSYHLTAAAITLVHAIICDRSERDRTPHTLTEPRLLQHWPSVYHGTLHYRSRAAADTASADTGLPSHTRPRAGGHSSAGQTHSINRAKKRTRILPTVRKKTEEMNEFPILVSKMIMIISQLVRFFFEKGKSTFILLCNIF